jgi:ABC-type nitrate/sulfonate/bicarbonate transport system permease component
MATDPVQAEAQATDSMNADTVTPRRQPRRVARSARLSRLAPFVAVAIFLAIWQIVGSVSNPLLIPTFTAVVQSFYSVLVHGPLLSAIGASAIDFFVGFALALVTGFIAGVAMGAFDVVDRTLAPFVNFMNSTPVVAFIPIIIIWLGEGAPARIFFVWMIAVWAVLVNTLTGVRNVDAGYLEVGKAFGLSWWHILRKVRIPAAMPYVFAGVRLALGHALIGMLVGEMDMELAGLGGIATDYGNSFETSKLLAVIFVASAFGIFVVWLLKLIQLAGFRWISETAGR